jgi:hypothetical protein
VPPGPWGIDAVPLFGGGVAVVCTSPGERKYTIIRLNADGTPNGSPSVFDMPLGCGPSKHAIFIPGYTTYVALSCPTAGQVAFVPTDLDVELP